MALRFSCLPSPSCFSSDCYDSCFSALHPGSKERNAHFSSSSTTHPRRASWPQAVPAPPIKTLVVFSPDAGDIHDELSTDVGTDATNTDSDLEDELKAESDTESASCIRNDVGSVQDDVNKVLQVEQVSPWQPQNFQRIRTLQEARSMFGNVLLMKHSEDGAHYAVKKIPRQWMTESSSEFDRKHPRETERVWMDIGILRYLSERDFQYSCKIRGVFQDERSMYVASSFAEHGDLCSWCVRQHLRCRFGEEREAVIRPIVKQMLEAVRHLHDLGIAHRDLSLENVVLCSGEGDGVMSIKLIDFAMSTFDDPCGCTQVCGKKAFRSPEMSSGKPYNAFLADTFALGVMIFILALDDYPWKSTVRGDCKCFEYCRYKGFRKLLQVRPFGGRTCRRSSMIEVLSESLLQVVEGLTEFHPRDRCTLGEEYWKKSKRQRAVVWEKQWLE